MELETARQALGPNPFPEAATLFDIAPGAVFDVFDIRKPGIAEHFATFTVIGDLILNPHGLQRVKMAYATVARPQDVANVVRPLDTLGVVPFRQPRPHWSTSFAARRQPGEPTLDPFMIRR
jgi:hypothetical protein